MGKRRYYTQREANGVLREVETQLLVIQRAWAAWREAEANVKDLEQLFGPESLEGSPEGQEYAGFHSRARDARRELEAAHEALAALGVELKDPVTGLVDFYSRRGDETVYLCWRLGESRVEHWHPLQGGFAGRRRIEEFPLTA